MTLHLQPYFLIGMYKEWIFHIKKNDGSTVILFIFRAVRWYVTMNGAFTRDVQIGLQRTQGTFRTTVQTAGYLEDVNLDQLRTELAAQIDRFTNLGSGWTLVNIESFTIHIAQYRPLAGSSYIETPRNLAGKHALINVENEDNECFKWAVLSGLFPASSNTNKMRMYVKYADQVNWDGLRFPVTLPQIRHFERNNID